MDENSDEETVDNGLKFKKSSNTKMKKNEKSHTGVKQSTDTNSKQNNMEGKYVQRKDLMNCIAFEQIDESKKSKESWSEARYSDDFDSLSSDTTSDITDVSPHPESPHPSSSGCSSLTKAVADKANAKSAMKKKQIIKDQTHPKHSTSKTFSMTKNEKKREEEGEQALKFLKEALNSLDCGNSVKTTSSCTGKQIYPRPKNMTFNREQMRNIDRENLILLRKIQSSRKKPTVDNSTPNYSRVSSSAINRQRQQRKIEFENSILLQKIQRVKGTTNTITGLRRF